MSNTEMNDELRITLMTQRLERAARITSSAPSTDFTAMVMAAVAAEPLPSPSRALFAAVRRGSASGAIAALRDVVIVSLTGGRPALVRIQATVLVIGLLTASTAIGAAAATGAAGVIGVGHHLAPSPSPHHLVTVGPDATDAASPVRPSASHVPPSTIPAPTETPSLDPSVSSAPTPDSSSGPTPSSVPHQTARPTSSLSSHPLPSTSPHPTASPSPEPSDTPGPSDTPEPTPSSGSDGGGDGSNPTPTPASN
jgi:hypothetical protein